MTDTHTLKIRRHRRAVISFLLSHVAGWRSLTPRMTLLHTLAHVQDSIKETALLPLLKELASPGSLEEQWAKGLSVTDQRHFTVYLLDCFTARVAKAISRGQATDTFNLVLTIIRKENEAESSKSRRRMGCRNVRSPKLEQLPPKAFCVKQLCRRLPILYGLPFRWINKFRFFSLCLTAWPFMPK